MKVAVLRRLTVVVTSAAIVGSTLVVATSATTTAAPAKVTAPQVWPQPQHQKSRPDGFPVPPTAALITGDDTDQPALRVVRDVLADAGVRRFVTADDDAPLPGAPLHVYVGGPSENTASAGALDDLGLEGPGGLEPEGYVLGIGRDRDDHALVVLSGRDSDGTFYAAQSLRQLVVPHTGRSWLPGVEIRDWPTSPLRGVIEGFYGPPWSAEDRLDQMDFYAATKQNVYVYSPKDDPYLRARWREPYPADDLAVIQRLVDRAREDHVDFTYALSPGLSVCYSSDADEQALVDKFQSLWDIGVRAFAIPLDDISYTDWNCEADQARWGTGGGAAGHAQAYLLNRVQQDFIDTHPGADRLEMVPTEYYNVSDSPYKTALREELDPAVIAEWTGVGVVPGTITAAQAKQAEEVFGHDILIWDNYPVNDYASDRLLLGPYTGREPGVTDHVVGITANPMVQAQPSKIAEFGSGAYLWNTAAYDADAAWLAGLRFLAGPAWRALKVFAENNYSSVLNPQESPVLSPLVDDYWKAYDTAAPDLAARAGALSAYFAQMASAPQQLEDGMGNPAFVSESQPWLDKLGLYGQAGRTAVDMLAAQRSGDGATAWRKRLALEDLRSRLSALSVTVAPGVMEPFLDRAVEASDRWLGAEGGLSAETSMGQYQSYAPENMVDGDPATFFWSNRAPKPGDYVGVDLGTTETIGDIDISMSKPSSPSDYIHQGVLEYSEDGSSWTTLATVSEQAHVTASAPAGTKARYVRLRVTADQGSWAVVDEFTVGVVDGDQLTVSGEPAAAGGSSLRYAADGSVATTYVASRSPAAGDALQVSLSRSRQLAAVSVLQDPEAAADGQVEVRSGDGPWRAIGRLDGGYTELDTGAADVDAIRIAWAPGTVAPTVHEVVPWYAASSPVSLEVDPDSLGLEAGGDSAGTVVDLGAERPGDVTGTLTVDAPAGWQVEPRQQDLTVYRGSGRQVDVRIQVPAGTAARQYDVPVTFTADGQTVSTTLTVAVHPRAAATNIATGGTAEASCVEGDGAYPQFDPRYAIDADLSTRWSSCYDDAAWLQVHLPQSAQLGKVVLHWEASYGEAYEIQTSSDGTHWTTAAVVGEGDGGTDTVYLDETPTATYVRMQGVKRALSYGFSLYEMEVYPLA